MKFSLGRRGIYLVAVAVTAFLALSLIPAPLPAVASPIQDSDMIDLINGERAANGLPGTGTSRMMPRFKLPARSPKEPFSTRPISARS